jgi:hypothetical protein
LLNSRSHSTKVDDDKNDDEDDATEADDDDDDDDHELETPSGSVAFERNVHRHRTSPFAIGTAKESTS